MRPKDILPLFLPIAFALQACESEPPPSPMHATPAVRGAEEVLSEDSLIPWDENNPVVVVENTAFRLDTQDTSSSYTAFPFYVTIDPAAVKEFRQRIAGTIPQAAKLLIINAPLEAGTGDAFFYTTKDGEQVYVMPASFDAIVARHVYPRFADRNLMDPNDPDILREFTGEITGVLLNFILHEAAHYPQVLEMNKIDPAGLTPVPEETSDIYEATAIYAERSSSQYKPMIMVKVKFGVDYDKFYGSIRIYEVPR